MTERLLEPFRLPPWVEQGHIQDPLNHQVVYVKVGVKLLFLHKLPNIRRL